MRRHPTVLVTAATGRQGGATARALLTEGSTSVRVLVRNPEGPNARALAAAGAELVVGDLDDLASLRAACAGVQGVFSMQSPIVSATGVDFSKEVQQGKNLIEAALAERVETYVHTATSGVGDHRNIEGWAEGRWKEHEVYWENKLATCERVRSAGFRHWTLILPATFMDHAMLDTSAFVDGHRWVTVLEADRPIPLIAPEDVGNASAAALLNPARFHGVTLQLAGDVLTPRQMAEVLSRVDAKTYTVQSSTIEEAVAAGLHPGVARGLTYMNVAPALARPELASDLGLSLMRFEPWLRQRRIQANREALSTGSPSGG
ncbi:NmrA family NAD(P)-binding protein [Myxococcus faecalis]|uniref:NmrA family NAD(P)-binding protein n=1 Tax=Myxococcus faecalis TaxID=3115646 RepID=UPI003CFB3FB9